MRDSFFPPFFLRQPLTRAPSVRSRAVLRTLHPAGKQKAAATATTTATTTTALLIKSFFRRRLSSLSSPLALVGRYKGCFQNHPIAASLCPENITPGDYTNYLLSQESHGSSGNNKCVIHSAATPSLPTNGLQIAIY